jgi:hypothetical protein
VIADVCRALAADSPEHAADVLEAQDPEHLTVLRAVLEFLEQGRGELHTCVRFLGD